MTDKSVNSQKLGAVTYAYNNIEIVEIAGKKRVRNKNTGEIMPMQESYRKSRSIYKWLDGGGELSVVFYYIRRLDK